MKLKVKQIVDGGEIRDDKNRNENQREDDKESAKKRYFLANFF